MSMLSINLAEELKAGNENRVIAMVYAYFNPQALAHLVPNGNAQGAAIRVQTIGEANAAALVTNVAPAVPAVPAHTTAVVPPPQAAPSAPEAAAAAPSLTVPADGSVFFDNVVTTPPQSAANAPAPASAPTAPAGMTSPAAGVELDARGLPWDAQIHSTTKTKNKDNTWRQLRNIDKEKPGLVQAVEATLRLTYPDPAATQNVPAHVVAPPVPTPPASTPAVPTPPVPGVPVVPNPPAVPSPPVAPPVPTPPVPPVPPAPAAVTPTNFIEMMTKIANLMDVQQVMTLEEVEACIRAVGITSMVLLMPASMQDATLIPRLDAEIERFLIEG